MIDKLEFGDCLFALHTTLHFFSEIEEQWGTEYQTPGLP